RSWVANLLYSRPMWLTAGVYRLSFYAKMTNNAGIQGPLWSGVMSTERLGKDTPAGTQNITTNWVRYTNTFTASTNGFYHVAFRHLQPYVFVVDDIQLEAGTEVTEYAPKTQVEIGVDTEVPGGVFLLGEGPRFRVRVHNGGSSYADPRVLYQVFDLHNTLLDE